MKLVFLATVGDVKSSYALEYLWTTYTAEKVKTQY